MAGKYNVEPSRKAVSVPFADGLQDPRLGLAQNVMLYKQNDIFNGEFKYLAPRPSFIGTEKFNTSEGFPSPVGIPKSTATWGTSYVLNTDTNIWISLFPQEGNPVLSGADQAAYAASATLSDDVNSVVWENVATGTSNLCVPLSSNSSFVNVTNPSSLAYVVQPLGFVPVNYCVAMDGYLFIAENGTDSIFNSALNDLTTWTLGVNYIKASQNPGNILALYRHKNYVVAFKEHSIEYFANAGLNNTSPLQRNASYTKQVGLLSDKTLAYWGDSIFFVGTEGIYGSPIIFELDSSFNCNPISTPSVEALYATFTRPKGTCIKVYGKSLYVLSDLQSNTLLIYNIEDKTWATWISSLSYTHTVPSCFQKYTTQSPIAFFSAVNDTMVSVLSLTTKDKDVSGIYSPVISETKIPSFDFGTNNRKFMHEMSLSVIAPDTMNHSMSLVKTVGGNRQTVTQSTTIGDNMSIKNWGQFVSAYVTYTLFDPSASNVVGLDSTYIRINSVIMEVSSGTS